MNSLNAEDISALIPHRDPFLFVKNAVVVSETEIEGVICWDASHPILQGHFPQQPLVPGVCQVEACAQLAGVLLAWSARKNSDIQIGLGVLGAIHQARFHRLLCPGVQLHLVCKLRAMSQTLFLVKAAGQSDGQATLLCEFVIRLHVATPSPKA